MKLPLIPLLFTIAVCHGQEWQLEASAGLSGYSGDLTQNFIPFKTIKPAAGINVKYNIDNTLLIRGGITWINVEGNDKYNRQENLKSRNLNFKSTIWEASLCAEFNLLEPDFFYAYPYVFAGAGIFRFNPYTYDRENKKTYLQPLGTEGQGIEGYPYRKPYSLTQFCLPIGAGWKVSLNRRYEIIYELGYRFLFTDYLDDVSTTYVSPGMLLANKGPKAVELAYRQPPDGYLPRNGDVRGNPGVKDGYFVSVIKLMVALDREQSKNWKRPY